MAALLEVLGTAFVIDKGEVATEIGDTKQVDFYPQVKVTRWANEVNFSARLVNAEDATFGQVADKVGWDAATKSAEFYELDNGFEFAVTLKEPPPSNVLQFTVQSKGLEFYYQPPLANVNADGSTWQANEGGGHSYRPAHLSGGYVAYHATKAGNEYRAGKAFEVHRPWAEDAKGTRVWCDLLIDSGIMSITVPQKFLDTAVYPVLVDPTIGYSTVGGSIDTIPLDKFIAFTAGAGSQTDGSGGTLSAIKIALSDPSGNHIKLAMYPNTGTTPPASGASPASQSVVSGSSTGALTITRTTTPVVDADWTVGSGLSATLAANTYYWICADLDNPAEETSLYYDTAADYSIVRADSSAYSSFPPATAPASFSVHDTRKFSVYATYTSPPATGACAVIINVDRRIDG